MTPVSQKGARPGPLKSIPVIAGLIFLALVCRPCLAWALEPSEVMILVNQEKPISLKVGEMYQKLRGIPSRNVLTLSLGGEREITRQQYRARVVKPVRAFLQEHPAIRCIVTTSGVPYVIRSTSGRQDGAAFDNELATVLRPAPKNLSRWQPNPLFLGGKNQLGITNPRKLRMIFVARLDGPDLKTVTRMVEDAVAVEKAGLQGPVFGDARGLDGITGYAGEDFSVRQAIDRFSDAGFHSTLHLQPRAWAQPQGRVGDQAAGAAFYVGWSRRRLFQDIFGKQGLARGAIAWHMSSAEASDIWGGSKGWCAGLLRRGAAVTLGSVGEGYVQAYPRGGIFAERLLAGETVAESYWLALPDVSWTMVILGDPLYKPFADHPRPALVARAYIAAAGNHVLKKGETSALLIQLQCVGPAGSGTPPMSATAEAGTGLAAASGSVDIPALRAGEGAVVRVPSVTASGDASGMFRLTLKMRDRRDRFRRIVLEGRIGFSRLTGGSEPASQMFFSPDGKLLISGQPGKSRLIHTETLQAQDIVLGKGLALVGADFAPDSRHVVLAIVNPVKKQAAVLITDSNLGAVHTIPPGTQYMRWLTADRVLLKAGHSLISHSIAGGPDRKFPVPAGWEATVIPDTAIQVLISADGRLAVKKDAKPMQEILEKAGALHDIAVANDLALFGGVDSRNRLWVQHGFSGKPEIIANRVKQVLWGPVSHRGIVQDTSGRSRIYDGRSRKWTDLGRISAAEWSRNEKKLLFLESTQKNGASNPAFLAILAGGKIRRLCSFDRIGQLVEMGIAGRRAERAFLLAGLAGSLDVWMMALPSGTPQNRPAGSRKTPSPRSK